MPQHAPRRIKVAPHFAARRYSGYRITSKLLLQGNWLEAAGFAPGAVAQVEVQAGRLIITPIQ